MCNRRLALPDPRRAQPIVREASPLGPPLPHLAAQWGHCYRSRHRAEHKREVASARRTERPDSQDLGIWNDASSCSGPRNCPRLLTQETQERGWMSRMGGTPCAVSASLEADGERALEESGDVDPGCQDLVTHIPRRRHRHAHTSGRAQQQQCARTPTPAPLCCRQSPFSPSPHPAHAPAPRNPG
jgi:hypothetical protein